MQLAYIMEDRLKDIAEEADKETALKDVAEATIKEKPTATKSAKAWARGVERDRAQAEQQRAEAEAKLGELSSGWPAPRALLLLGTRR